MAKYAKPKFTNFSLQERENQKIENYRKPAELFIQTCSTVGVEKDQAKSAYYHADGCCTEVGFLKEGV